MQVCIQSLVSIFDASACEMRKSPHEVSVTIFNRGPRGAPNEHLAIVDGETELYTCILRSMSFFTQVGVVVSLFGEKDMIVPELQIRCATQEESGKLAAALLRAKVPRHNILRSHEPNQGLTESGADIATDEIVRILDDPTFPDFVNRVESLLARLHR